MRAWLRTKWAEYRQWRAYVYGDLNRDTDLNL